MRTILAVTGTLVNAVATGLLVFLVALTPAHAALTHSHLAVKAISKAYGFVLGQHYSLARIESTYPEAAMQVELARLTFNSAFPGVEKKLEAELIAALTEPKFKELRSEMINKIRPLLVKQAITPQLAQQFLDQVKARAKGDEMEPDVLRYLLAVLYAANPVAEFGDGFRQRFRTDGTGKSQGVRLILQLPRSWLAKDGERPHIVQKWISQGGDGDSMILLLMFDAEGSNPTQQEITQFVQSGEVRAILPELGRMRDAGTFALEKRTGFWVDMSLNMERVGVRMYARGSMHQLFINGKWMQLQCMSYAKETEPNKADAAARLNKPICHQALNSLVLEQAS